MRRRPWPKEVIDRLVAALDRLTDQFRARDEVAALVLFGSYARGEFGRKSDVDLLILFDGHEPPEATEAGGQALRLCGEIESEARLPMHLAPPSAGVEGAADLGPTFLHALWTDGVVLFARASALSRLQPAPLVPWVLIHFSTARMPLTDRVRLSRRLHGFGKRPSIVRPPAIVHGPGSLLLPATQQQSVVGALDVTGASYDVIPV